MQSGKETNRDRWTGLDALRGIAVLLMLAQHIVYWISADLHHSNTVRIIGGLGGLAAPLFVLLAGVGATLTAHRHRDADRLLLGRGAMVLGFGFLLNLLTPSWFTFQSWYVLHMIGLGLMTAPVLRRMPPRFLIGFVAGIVLITVLFQHHLKTPFFLFNRQMAGTHLPGGWLRLALIEGFFPVFPWIAYFATGVLAGRWLLRDTMAPLWRLATVLCTLSLALPTIYLLGFKFADQHPWVRLFKPIPNFYPSLTPITLFLIATALFFTALFADPPRRHKFGAANALVCLGRCSLSVLIVHVATIRGAAVQLGLFRTQPLLETLALTAALMLLFTIAAYAWRKSGFRFGAEWLMRKAFP